VSVADARRSAVVAGLLVIAAAVFVFVAIRGLLAILIVYDLMNHLPADAPAHVPVAAIPDRK
jgi:hypothetical protein